MSQPQLEQSRPVNCYSPVYGGKAVSKKMGTEPCRPFGDTPALSVTTASINLTTRQSENNRYVHLLHVHAFYLVNETNLHYESPLRLLTAL